MARKFTDGNPLYLETLKHRASSKAVKQAGIKPLSPAAAALARSGRGGSGRRAQGELGHQ